MIKAEHENVTIIGSDEEMISDMIHVNSCFIRLLKARGYQEECIEKIMVNMVAKGFDEDGEIIRMEEIDE